MIPNHKVTVDLDIIDLRLLIRSLEDVIDDPDLTDDEVEKYTVMLEGFVDLLTALQIEEEYTQMIREEGEL